MSPHHTPVPVTVLSGYLGAGKTTLLNHLLSHPQNRDIAVIVNDMGEVNIDAELIATETGSDGIIDLTNGCICCRLQDDLLSEANRLAETREFDHLVVEASGISEPIPIARTFTAGADESDIDPTDRFSLDTMVTVLDSYGFWKEFGNGGASIEEPDSNRSLADVLVEGIEFCNVLVMNKCDMVPEEVLDEIESLVRKLGPEAKIIRTTYAEIDPEEVLGTDLFDLPTAMQSPDWKRELSGSDPERNHEHSHTESAAETHGVSSFVYRESRPFHPERFNVWLDDCSGDIIRAKGFFSLASRSDSVMGLSQAGASIQVGPLGRWDGDENSETRLVFIGTDLDENTIMEELDSCLVSEEEHLDREFDDPFPAEETAIPERE